MSRDIAHPKAILPILRREFVISGAGLGSLAMAALAADSIDSRGGPVEAIARRRNPSAGRLSHFPARANAVIQLFMAGGPSQLELFDDKPRLREMDGQIVPPSFVAGKRFLFIKPDAKLLGSRRKFRRYGNPGLGVSELLPHFASIVDDVTMIKTMYTDNFSHGGAKLLMQTGYARFGFPTMGAWLLYGLGSVSQNLPGYVVLQSGPRGPRGGAYLWSNGFLPASFQGVPFRSQGQPILNLAPPAGISDDQQRRVINAIAHLNQAHMESTLDDETEARIANYEMAFRMQQSAPELSDISSETQSTLDLYGVTPGQPSFAMNCLLARRLVERGVRFVTIFHTDWDQHGGNENLEGHLEHICHETDQPSAALVKDLKQRGLLDETIVVWGGEFGRTPMGEVRETIGRDHHVEAFCTWLAGGGVRPGYVIGETDELGFGPRDLASRIHVHDLQATILHLLGLDHERLTYALQGRQFRLTDVGGRVVEALIG